MYLIGTRCIHAVTFTCATLNQNMEDEPIEEGKIVKRYCRGCKRVSRQTVVLCMSEEVKKT